ncbi:hypothetical protein M409DRAFT_27377 [Zasmidium cellare ATCC 36951]|uniref:Uncharacterized protein n=1 Tax=Zasmidium cellare ATCC 36951 TaxID=1080233 RepID=A0A6A6C9N8_ZASCE|nr:uncharacterized protein M409DRAFT_27377 [Zasmidium cellare ATCC 36951]KAF2162369.1 hypothetical protein M409DRAFT_27377 [Zasmidium cellare ATCC 36951]
MYAIHKLENLKDTGIIRKFAQLNVEAIRAIQDRPLLYAPQFIRGLESWREELQRSRLACWICVYPNAKNGSVTLEEGQWVGIHRLRGPLSPTEYNFFKDASLETTADELCTRWIAERLYIKPDHRNVELGNLIYCTSMEYLTSRTQSLLQPNLATSAEKHADIRISLTAYHGTASFGIHRAGTLRAIREVTRVEDLDYDGLLDQVPAGLLGTDDYTKPVGTLSESVQDIMIRG